MNTLINYTSAPEAEHFTEVSIDRLKEIQADIINSRPQTEWSHAALESDQKAVAMAIAAAEQGRTIYAAQDEDGYYFATDAARDVNSSHATLEEEK